MAGLPIIDQTSEPKSIGMEVADLHPNDGLQHSSKDLPSVNEAELSEHDDLKSTHDGLLDMKRMGKKQELPRNFRLISSIAFTTCVMGTWEILLTASTQGLTAGGLTGLFWSLCWVYFGQFFVVLSLAEMASMSVFRFIKMACADILCRAPTAGGQYQ